MSGLPSLEACRARQRICLGPGPSYGGLSEIAHPHKVIHRRCEGEEPADSRYATELDFAHQAYRLQPTEDLFDSFPLLLTDRIASVSRGPT